MKFKDIKVGDVVYCMEAIDLRRGVRVVSKAFPIAQTVERVTKTQFVAGGVRFGKQYGCAHGDGSGNARMLGESTRYAQDPRIEGDQTAERDAYKKYVGRVESACDYLQNCVANRVISLRGDDLLRVVEHLEAIGELLDG